MTPPEPMRRPDFEAVAELDRRLARQRPVDHGLNLRKFDALYRLAVQLGVWRTGDPLAGIEGDVRYARAINGRRAPR
jgi:hypothetical protein